jgi:hypothetical protein
MTWVGRGWHMGTVDASALLIRSLTAFALAKMKGAS